MEIINLENYNAFGALKIDYAVEVIEETLNLTHQEVVSIRKYGINPKRIDIGIKGNSFRKESIQDNLGESVRISSGHIVTLNTPNCTITDVYVKGAPLEWSEVRYSRIFGFYGDVKMVKFMGLKEHETTVANYAQKENGIVKIRMRIRKGIPSSLTVDNERIEIYYRSQIRTCWICGKGHFKKDCDTISSTEYVNRFKLDEFPALQAATRVTQTATMVEAAAADEMAFQRVMEAAAAQREGTTNANTGEVVRSESTTTGEVVQNKTATSEVMQGEKTATATTSEVVQGETTTTGEVVQGETATTGEIAPEAAMKIEIKTDKMDGVRPSRESEENVDGTKDMEMTGRGENRVDKVGVDHKLSSSDEDLDTVGGENRGAAAQALEELEIVGQAQSDTITASEAEADTPGQDMNLVSGGESDDNIVYDAASILSMVAKTDTGISEINNNYIPIADGLEHDLAHGQLFHSFDASGDSTTFSRDINQSMEDMLSEIPEHRNKRPAASSNDDTDMEISTGNNSKKITKSQKLN